MNDKISLEIKQAMLKKLPARLRALRSIKSQLDILNSSGKEVSSELQMAVLQKMIKQRRESAEIYISNNRQDLSKMELEDILVIEEFLPEQLTKEEVEEEVRKIISSVGATSIREIGKVMGVASKNLSGKSDNKVILEIAKSILS